MMVVAETESEKEGSNSAKNTPFFDPSNNGGYYQHERNEKLIDDCVESSSQSSSVGPEEEKDSFINRKASGKRPDIDSKGSRLVHAESRFVS